jgi:type I restriction-modification system DNA methylase subunit
MPAPVEIVQLVELFQRNYAQYRDPAFSETAVRHQFIDPLFAALGWDVNNIQGFAEQYKEVVHEDKVRVGGAAKAPDYAFRIGKERKFFVEAKKPAVNITSDVEPAYQLRRYAWSAKLPLSILTDFEEFSVYDCRTRPDKSDKAATGRIFLLNYRDYVTRWDEIAGVFSKAAVWQGALDKFAEAKAGKRGTAEVDDEFLAEIERWRELLARNLALRNPTLRGRDLNWAVQQIIDRIVFLRICEARDLETFEQLRALLNGGRTYERLQELFRRADYRYNSGLFHFEEEKDRAEAPDTLTPGLEIDDKALKDIIEHLYFPESPYEFSVIPADILGHVYERFLGKVIRLTPGRQVKIEEKPEVRKAGGVYYTPTYIVDYIVRQTVGPLVEGKTPVQVGGAARRPERSGAQSKDADHPLRIADIACGSGSFLLGAYQFLLDWYLAEYLKAPDRWLKGKRPPLERASGGVLRLTIEERKRILMSHIYGVDIDPQAVEVTKLSLLLKVLEGEGVASQMSFLPERVLPDPGRNIKCGNSLIGPDFYDRKFDLPDEETTRRVNAFDWAREFPDVFPHPPTPSPELRFGRGGGQAGGEGGFDAVIGNPPWGADFDETQTQYFRTTYRTGASDSYAIFVEAGLRKTRSEGHLSFITPDTFLRKDGYEAVRRFFLEENVVQELIETGPVFSGVRDTWCLVFRLKRALPDDRDTVVHRKISRFVVSAEERLDRFAKAAWDDVTHVKQMTWMKRPQLVVGYLASEMAQAIVEKVERHPRLGVQMEYRVSRGEEGSKFNLVESADGDFDMVIPADVFRYHMTSGIKIRSTSLTPGKLSLLYSNPKLWIIRIQKMRWKQRIVCTLDERQNSAGMKTLQTIVSSDGIASLKYLQGILASRLINFWCINYLADDMNKAYLERIPIRTINFADPTDVARHDRMVSLVTQMLDLHARLAAEGVPHEKAALQRRIELTDRQIDALVYELYGLTAEEIAVVEGA